MIGSVIDKLFSAWTSRRMRTHLPYPSSSTALLLIDVQRAFIEPDMSTGTQFHQLAQQIGWFRNIREFIQVCRDEGFPVIHAPFQVPASSEEPQSNEIPFIRFIRDRGLLVKGTEGVNIPREIVDDKDLLLDHRSVLNVFYGTELKSELESRGISHLLVCGSVANAGVDSTGRMGVELDYDVTFVSDCIAALDRESYKASIDITFPRMGNRVLTSQDIQQNWLT